VATTIYLDRIHTSDYCYTNVGRVVESTVKSDRKAIMLTQVRRYAQLITAVNGKPFENVLHVHLILCHKYLHGLVEINNGNFIRIRQSYTERQNETV